MRRVLFLCLLLALSLPVSSTLAQDTTPSPLIPPPSPTAPPISTEAYDNPDLGISFALPEGWEVQSTLDTLLAGPPEALAALSTGGVPAELVLRIVVGSFLDLNLENAATLPDQLARLVPNNITPPPASPVTYGNSEGWAIEYAIPESGLSSRVALLSLSNGRLALVRGVAASDAWAASESARFEQVVTSLEFSLPAALADPLANLPDDDGGVFWHYERPQPPDSAEVRLGGLSFDPFGVLYVAAGPRGILSVDMGTGALVGYLGSWFDDDNLVDISIPADAKIYAANATPGDNNHILIVNRAGSYEFSFGSQGDAPGQFAPGMPQTLVTTRNSDIWTVSEGHSAPPAKRLYKFDRFGNLLLMVDIDDINPALSEVRIDNNVNTDGLYLVGATGGLNLVDASGTALVTNLGLDVFAIATPTDIAVAPSDNIIVSTDAAGLLEFAPSGELVDRFGLSLPADHPDNFAAGTMIQPEGLVVGDDGMVFFAETNPINRLSQIQALRFAGDGLLPLPNQAEPAADAAPSEAVDAALNLDPALGGGNIEYGAVVQGSLNNQHPAHEWFFEGSPGDRVRITMRDISLDGALDTQLSLFDPNRYLQSMNDDISVFAPEGFRASDSVIEYELRSFGFHIIEATRFGGRGEYELTLELLTDTDEAEATSESTPEATAEAEGN